MKQLVALKELRENFGKYEDLVKEGYSFIVMKRSRPILRIGPVEDEEWETIIDFTNFRKKGVPLEELIARLKKQLD